MKSLNDVNSSMAESLNARKNRRLKTLCTVDIVHYDYIPLILFKFIRWDNKKIIATQTRHMKKSLQDGEMMIKCPLLAGLK